MIPIRDDNPLRITPVMTWLILGLCVAAFLWQLSLGRPGFERAIYALGLIPAVLFDRAELPAALSVVPPAATVLTSMFMHGGVLHLAGNMLYLWIFADNVEDALGHVRFLLFYLACGVVAAAAQALPAPESRVPMVGASGAISGVLGAYLLMFPRSQVLVAIPFIFFVQLIRLPALVVLGFWFFIQLLSSLMGPAEQGVAFRAHLGGFVAGMALLPLFRLGRGRPGYGSGL